jgi:O-antigen/teichoic acid export membrane protein
MSQSSRILFGIKWVGVSLFVTQGLQFLTTIVLARLLTPEIFGLVAMARVATNLISIIRQLGFSSAFIQRRDRGPEEARVAVNTMFYLLVITNAALFIAAWLLSPVVARFFENEALDRVLRVLVLGFFIQAFVETPSVVLQKNLDFGKIAFSQIVASIFLMLISISLAAKGYGVWSLVVGQIGANLVHALVLIKVSGWRPRLEFAPQIAKQLFRYGKYLWVFSILSALGDSLDRIIVGRWLGAGSLGIYGLALNLSKLPANQVSMLVNRITFPAFSKIQDDKSALTIAFLRTLSHVSIVTFPLGIGLAAVSENMVLSLYGQKWMEAAPIIAVLAYYGMVLSVSSIAGPIFRAIGRPNVLLYTALFHHTLLVVFLLILGRYGAVGIAYAVLIPMIISSTIAFALIVRYLEFRVLTVVEHLLRAGLPSLAMYFAIESVTSVLDTLMSTAPVKLLIQIVVGVLICLVFTMVFNRAALDSVYATIKSSLQAKGRLV